MGIGKGILKGTGKFLGDIGKAAMFGTELTGKAAISTGKRIANESSKNLLRTAAAVGTGAVFAGTLADLDGNTDRGKAAAVGAGIGLASSAIPGASAAIAYTGALGASSVLGAAEGLSRMGGKLIKMPKNLSLANTDEISLTNLGRVAVYGSALVGGVKDAVDYFKRSRSGVNDGLLRSATPVVPLQQNSTP